MTENIGQEFMKKTRYEYLSVSDQRRGLPQPPLQVQVSEADSLIELPAAGNICVEPLDVRDAIERRASVRRYADRPLALYELSYLLWCTQGVKEVSPDNYYLRRNVPSAGARHAFETYLLVNNVEGLQAGLYRFLSIEHKLIEVDLASDVCPRITRACWDQRFVAMSAVTFIWVAVVYRMTWRYGQRGYRYLHLDAGHVAQNLYLAAQSVGCGTCAIAAFDDEDLAQVIGVDGEEQFPIYVATVGKES